MQKPVIFLFLLFLATQTLAQSAGNPALSKLYTQKADEINCAAIQALLKKLDKNINTVPCATCSYEQLLKKIPYTKTKQIAKRIDDKKKSLAAGLTKENIADKLESLLAYAAPAIANPGVSAAENDANKKILASVGAQIVREATDQANQIAEPVAETAVAVTETPTEPKLASDSSTGILQESVLETTQTQTMNYNSDFTTIWLPLIIGAVSILAILITLASLSSLGRKVRTLRNDVEEIQSTLEGITQKDQRLGNSIRSFEKENERMTDRLSEFESILFELKQKLG